MKQYYFLAGIPRSGSTVLASILNQNPDFYATPTSPLLDLLYLNEQAWSNLPSVIANPIPIQRESISKAIIKSCWEHIDRPIIIDKHRAWGRNIRTIEKIFEIRPKLIITVRDIPSVIASFIELLRASSQSITYIDQILVDRNLSLTDVNRADVIWNDFVQDPWDSFKTAWNTDKNSIHLVDYDSLVNNQQEVINGVYKFLEVPKFTHNFNAIENSHADDDLMAWGLENLHTIRPTLKKTSKSPRVVLGDQIYKKYTKMNLEFWRD